jgi:hypothetical protein
VPDDKNKRGGADRKRVAGEQKHEVAYVAKKTGKTPEAVKKAVKAAGPSRDKVEKKLKGS